MRKLLNSGRGHSTETGACRAGECGKLDGRNLDPAALGGRRRATVPVRLPPPPGACQTHPVFISNVDAGLERMVRARLPLPEEIGDVAFDAPSGAWSAQLSRITVNLFLYDVQRSAMPSRAATLRPQEDGPLLRRRPQPMIRLGYLVSAWAGSPRDEHQLLGDLVSMLACTEVIPEEFLPEGLTTSVQLSLGDDRSLPRELWTAAGGNLRAALQLQVTVGADSFGWEAAAPPVERISAMANRIDDPVPTP